MLPTSSQALVPAQQYSESSTPMRCSACFHPAFGLNYGVPSCNACKMFFRRVVLFQPVYTCRENNTCYQNIEYLPERPKCRACRFKRCIEVGMRYRSTDDETNEMMEVLSTADQAHPTVLVTSMDELCSMIQNLLVLDSRRFECLGRMRSDADPTIRDLLALSDRGFSVDRDRSREPPTTMSKNNEQILSQWSFFGVWTSIEFLKNLEFMSLLSPDDKLTMIRNYAMNSYLLSSAFLSVSRQSDRLVNPDGTETISSSLKGMFNTCNVDRIRTQLVTKLRELKITPQEYILTTIILFCTPSYGSQENGGEMSTYAREIVGERQRKYYNALMKYCMSTHGGQGPDRFQKIISIGELLAKCFGDVKELVDLLNVFLPTFHNSKKLFFESLHK